jgi:hypothetical protein
MNHPCGCVHPYADDTTGQALRKRMRAILRGEAYRTSIHPDDVFRLRAPAKGDAFEFGITINLSWCVEGGSSAKRLRRHLPRFRRDVEERLLNSIRPVCRKHAPFDPEGAEMELASAVHAGLGDAQYAFGKGYARPRPGRVHVSPAKEVRDIARTAWQRRQEMVHGHDLAELLRDQLGQRRGWWKTFIEEGLGDWLTPYAVRIAEDTDDISGTLARLRDEQRERYEELAGTVEEQARGYRESDDYETMLTNETVLRHLVKTIGLPVPDHAHPFGRSPDAEAVRGNGGSSP